MGVVSSHPVCRARVRVRGTVQGVGFRPFVYRLAREEGLVGFVLNDEQGVLLEVEGEENAVARFMAQLAGEPPPLAVIEAVDRSIVPAIGEGDFRIVESVAGGEPGCAGRARQRAVRRLPARAGRSRRPPLSIPVHQLHELRSALHDRPRRPLRPAADDDGAVYDVPDLRARVPRPRRPPLPRAAERLSRLRAALCGSTGGSQRRSDRATWPGFCVRGRSRPSRGSAASTSAATRSTSRRSRPCAHASTATTSRSR